MYSIGLLELRYLVQLLFLIVCFDTNNRKNLINSDGCRNAIVPKGSLEQGL